MEGDGARALRDSPHWNVIRDLYLIIGAIGGSRRPPGEKGPPIAPLSKREKVRGLRWGEFLSDTVPPLSKGGKR